MRLVSAEQIEAAGDWRALVDALGEAHRGQPAQVKDMLLRDGDNAWLSRAAWLPGGGDFGLKSMSVFPGNVNLAPPKPSINGGMLLFDKTTGELAAVLEGAALTIWKTVGDSALGAVRLAREDVAELLVVGAGTIASRLPEAYLAIRPSIQRVRVWNRTSERATALAEDLAKTLPVPVEAATDLSQAVAAAEIVACATMSPEPVIKGAWLKPGAHVDLIGAYRPDMREVDDDALRRGRLFVDSRDTTIGEIGELIIPMNNGVITEEDVLGDHYQLSAGALGRTSAQDITIFKNGGGAHLDLMTARFFLDRL